MQAPTSDQNHNPSPFFFSGATLMEDIERLSKSLTNIQHVSFEARLQQQVREFQEMVRGERESRSVSELSRQSCGRLQDMAEQGHAGAQYQIYYHWIYLSPEERQQVGWTGDYAMDMLHASAAQGHPWSQSALAETIKKEHPDAAILWQLAAARQGHPWSMKSMVDKAGKIPDMGLQASTRQDLSEFLEEMASMRYPPGHVSVARKSGV